MGIGLSVQGDTSSPSPSDISGIIQDAASRYGVDPATLKQFAALESSNNPKAVSSTGAKGLFQFMPGTAKVYGLRNPFDPAQNADAAARLTRDNQAKLTKALGRPPSAGELYLAHQQGANGAIALLKNPNQNAVDALAPVYGGSRARATQALSVNGGSQDMTAGAFANKWTARFGSPDKNAPLQLASASGAQSAPAASQQQDTNAAPSSDSPSSIGALGLTGAATMSGLASGLAPKPAMTVPLMQLSQTPAKAPDENLWRSQIAST
jgi:hypothetical protein